MRFIAIVSLILFTFSCRTTEHQPQSDVKGSFGKPKPKAATVKPKPKWDYGERTTIFSLESLDKPWYQTTCKPSEINTKLPIYKYYAGASKKQMPVKMFCELMRVGAKVKIKMGEWHQYYQGTIYQSPTIQVGIQDSKKFNSPDTWQAFTWNSFYNELFHAFWDQVFLKDRKYKSDRDWMLSKRNLEPYRAAISRKYQIALEEGLSETVANWISVINRSDGRGGIKFTPKEYYRYYPSHTVAAVSHYDQGGAFTVFGAKIENKTINSILGAGQAKFLPGAEWTYPSEKEYVWLFNLVLDTDPPPVQKTPIK